MIRLITSLAGGITIGGVYALVALGLVLAVRATRTFNFAYGELMLLPAFIVGYLQTRNVSLGFSLPLAFVVSAIVGALFYALVLRRTVGLPLFMGIVATFGLAAILDGIMGIVFQAGDYSIVIHAIPSGTVFIAGAAISDASLMLAGLTLALATLVSCVIRFTHLGLKVRASGQDPVLASQGGIHVRRIYLGSWALSAILAAVAGISYGVISGGVTVSLETLAVSAFPAIILGGLDSIEGAVIGGVVVGLIQGFTQTYLGGQYVDVVTYVLLLIVLLTYPQGLFGTKEVIRA